MWKPLRQSLRIFPVCFLPSPGFTSRLHHAWCFLWVMGIALGSSCLQGSTFLAELSPQAPGYVLKLLLPYLPTCLFSHRAIFSLGLSFTRPRWHSCTKILPSLLGHVLPVICGIHCPGLCLPPFHSSSLCSACWLGFLFCFVL